MEVAELLLEKDIDKNKFDKDGETALLVAVNRRHKAMVKLLLKHKPDLSIKNKYGDTAYKLAQLINDKDILKLFNENIFKNNVEQNVASISGTGNRKRKYDDAFSIFNAPKI